jgi:hypothetical protein
MQLAVCAIEQKSSLQIDFHFQYFMAMFWALCVVKWFLFPFLTAEGGQNMETTSFSVLSNQCGHEWKYCHVPWRSTFLDKASMLVLIPLLFGCKTSRTIHTSMAVKLDAITSRHIVGTYYFPIQEW